MQLNLLHGLIPPTNNLSLKSQEAMTTAAGQKSEVSEAEITKAFNSADMDSDGFVSRQEAKRAYKRLSKQFSRPIDSVSFTLMKPYFILLDMAPVCQDSILPKGA